MEINTIHGKNWKSRAKILKFLQENGRIFRQRPQFAEQIFQTAGLPAELRLEKRLLPVGARSARNPQKGPFPAAANGKPALRRGSPDSGSGRKVCQKQRGKLEIKAEFLRYHHGNEGRFFAGQPTQPPNRPISLLLNSIVACPANPSPPGGTPLCGIP